MMLIGSAASRRALLRQVWAMVQTRAEAASLVVSLQKNAVVQGLALYAVAALTASACITALIFFIAVAVAPEHRALALGLVVLALAAATAFAVIRATRQLRRDTALIADFTKGLRLDFAMINLALKDPEPDDEQELDKRERAKTAVREAAADKAGTPSTADGGAINPSGPSVAAATAAMSAASPPAPDVPVEPAATASSTPPGSIRDEAVARTAMRDGGEEAVTESSTISDAATEREMPEPPLTVPDGMTTRPTREYRPNGSA
jgi:uncharacterized membrane protein YqjE